MTLDPHRICFNCSMPFTPSRPACEPEPIWRMPSPAEVPTLRITVYGSRCAPCAALAAGSDTATHGRVMGSGGARGG